MTAGFLLMSVDMFLVLDAFMKNKDNLHSSTQILDTDFSNQKLDLGE